MAIKAKAKQKTSGNPLIKAIEKRMNPDGLPRVKPESALLGKIDVHDVNRNPVPNTPRMRAKFDDRARNLHKKPVANASRAIMDAALPAKYNRAAGYAVSNVLPRAAGKVAVKAALKAVPVVGAAADLALPDRAGQGFGSDYTMAKRMGKVDEFRDQAKRWGMSDAEFKSRTTAIDGPAKKKKRR